MARYVFLDSGVLHLVCTATETTETREFLAWAEDAPVRGTELIVADVIWFEVRRNLVLKAELGRKQAGDQLAKFDAFCAGVEPASVYPADWARACDFWSLARKGRRPTGDDRALDADAILAAMAFNLESMGHRVVIATTNLKDFRRFPGVEADLWRDIRL